MTDPEKPVRPEDLNADPASAPRPDRTPNVQPAIPDPAVPAATPAARRTSAAGLWAAWAILLVLTLAALGIAVLALRPDLRAGLPGPLGPPPPDARLTTRLANLESRIDGLTASVADLTRRAAASPPVVATPAPAGPEVGALTTRAQALEQHLGTLEAALQATRDEARGQEHDLSGRLDRSDARIEQLAQDQQKAAEATQHVAMALALGNLENALMSGRPYPAQLASLHRLGQKDDDIPTLVARADEGVPTQADLAARFPALADQAVRAERQAGSDTWFARLWARIRTLVVTRPVGNVAGAGTPAVLARAQVRLDTGDLSGAVGEVVTLKGAAGTVMADWLADAQARLAVEAELVHLRDHMVDDLTGRS